MHARIARATLGITRHCVVFLSGSLFGLSIESLGRAYHWGCMYILSNLLSALSAAVAINYSGNDLRAFAFA